MIIYVAQSSKDSEVRADEDLRIEKFGPPSRLKFWLRKSLILGIITNHRVYRDERVLSIDENYIQGRCSLQNSGTTLK